VALSTGRFRLQASLVFIVFILIVFICASCVLWWQLSRAQALNVQLQAELAKLRGRIRSLRE
jgi:DNA-binding transcriptional regulator of glucitol operon